MTDATGASIEAFLAGIEDIRDQRRSWLMLDHHVSGDTFVIDLISVDQPRQGLGSDVMRDILEHADEHGVAVELEASSHGGRNIRQRKLEKWYRGFGFETTGVTSSEGNPMMRRQPRAPADRNIAA